MDPPASHPQYSASAAHPSTMQPYPPMQQSFTTHDPLGYAQATPASAPARRSSLSGGAGSTGGGPAVGDKKPREVELFDELDGAESCYGGDDRPSAKKKHKGRAVLSCASCKKRKVKCDRRQPCNTCILRGEAERCSWDDPLANPESQPFALATQYDDVIARLDRIEQFLETLPSDLQRNAIKAGSALGDPSPVPSQVADAHSLKPKLSNEMETVVTNLEASTLRPPRLSPHGKAVGLDFLASAIDMVPPVRVEPDPPQSDLTSALTSIAAQPLRYEGPVSAASHGYDLCFSQREMVELRDRALDKVFSLLPSPSDATQIIEAYFNDVSWFYAILHPPAFRAEVERFEDMARAGRQNDVDTAWLAVFFAVLALGLDGAQSVEIPSLPFPSKAETSSAWYATSLRLFHLSYWPVQPHFRLVQAVALYGQYNLTSGGGTDQGGFLSYLAIGIRICQKLRLHQLGTNPKTMPPNDPAFPPGCNSLKRQLAIRVFGIIVFLDVVTANNKLGAYLVNPAQVTTPPPDNLNFDQLSATEWETHPAPRHVWTDTSLELNKAGGGRYMRLVFDKLVTNAKDFTYDTVLELDREMRTHLSNFPDSMTTENVQQEERNPKLRKQRFMSMSGAFSRLVRLHRPFLVTGFTNSRYRFSTDACLRAARKVIFAHSQGREPLKNLRIVHSHTLSAAIVIYSYIFHLIDTNAPISDIAREKETVATAYNVFSTTQVTSPMLSNVIRHATAIVSLLGEAVEDRQSQRSYRSQGMPPETFVQVLRRIAKQLQLAQSPAPDTPFSSQPSPASHGTPASTSAFSEAPSASTVATSTYQQSPLLNPILAPPRHSPLPPLVHSFASRSPVALPAPAPPPPQFVPTTAPPDPAYAALFLSDLGLSSAMRPGPDVYDLSWLEQGTYGGSYGGGPGTSFEGGSHPTPPTREANLSPYYARADILLPNPPGGPTHGHASSHAHGFVGHHFAQSSPVQQYALPGLGRSGSPTRIQPSKAWFLDGIEGADALYSQLK
ncbi:hypothetical protein JCM10212_006150 [Sporobolomyces blumeae]